MFLFTQPELVFDPEMLTFVRDLPEKTGQYLDWRLINSVQVDDASKTFLPANSRKYESLWIQRYQSNLQVSVEKIDAMFQEETSYSHEPRVNLTEKYREGKLYPQYLRGAHSQEKASFRDIGNHVQYFTYSEGLDLIGTNGQLLTFLAEEGIDLFCTLEKTGDVPSHGGFDLDRGIIVISSGCVPALPPLSRDGRPIQDSSYKIAWISVEAAYSLIEDNTTYFDPAKYDQDEILDSLLRFDSPLRHLNQGIDALRWNGVSEEDIATALAKAQKAAWPKIYEMTLADIDRAIDDMMDVAGVPKEWVLRRHANRTRGICDRMEGLSTRMEGVDLTCLSDLVELLQELKGRA
jgi:hypothetical protein